MTVSSVGSTRAEGFVSPSHSNSRRRRGPVSLAAAGSPRAQLLSINDDDQERKHRRRSLHLTNAVLSPGGTATPAANQVGLALERERLLSTAKTRVGMTNAQLKEHYSNCIKLSSENKINAKNAFGLHLIDYMKDLLKEAQNEDDTTNFQIASCTLDAGVKIYAGRVDSVHTDACRMLENLGKKKKDSQGGQEDSDTSSGASPKHPEEKKKKKNAGKTIETNLKNITCDNYDFAFEVDPFFCKTSADFDEGGTGGLMLNHLRVKDDSSELLLDSDATPYFISSPPPLEVSSIYADLSAFQDVLSKIRHDGSEICPQFSNFRFCGWDGISEAFSELRLDDTHRFDAEAPVHEEVTNHYGDSDDGECNYEDDVFLQLPSNPEEEAPATNFQDSLTIKDGKEAFIVNPATGTTQGLTTTRGGTLCLELSLEPSEYSYFRDDVLRTWAGPNHWKLRATAKENRGKNGSKKGGPKKEPFRLNYEDEKDFSKLFSFSKAATTLSAQRTEQLNTDNTTLPDLSYNADDLMRLFLKPAMKVKRQQHAMALNDDDNAWYNYDNANDRNNFCPELEVCGGDYDDDDGDMVDACGDDMTCAFPDMSQDVTQFSGNNGVDCSRFCGENLVPVPRKVEKIEIGYAKTAKRIDVKKLKKSIWNLLTIEEEEQNKENIPNNEDETRVNGNEDESVSGWHSFQDVYKGLPSKLSSYANKNLSVPIAFVCLLYLANEKELTIRGKDKLDDLMITQESSVISF